MGLVGDKILYIGTSIASITDLSDARAIFVRLIDDMSCDDTPRLKWVNWSDRAEPLGQVRH